MHMEKEFVFTKKGKCTENCFYFATKLPIILYIFLNVKYYCMKWIKKKKEKDISISSACN